jgi:hypothetical protein
MQIAREHRTQTHKGRPDETSERFSDSFVVSHYFSFLCRMQSKHRKHRCCRQQHRNTGQFAGLPDAHTGFVAFTRSRTSSDTIPNTNASASACAVANASAHA